MKKIELLAPAGNMTGLVAAIEAGADAVYIGGYAYSARSYAGNFSNEEIVEAINYAHLYGVKIYVAVNTIIYEDEIETFINYIDFLHTNNVDAIIIQDLGMLDLIRKTYPNLEIHASTQMHIHNLEGVKFAKKYGLKRVVLARETSIELIKEIKKEVDIDIEVFGHGALCVSYSGQCLMSSLIGGRSGNRGSCAGTCRLPYDLVSIDENKQKILNQNKYLLSMKDLNTLENIGSLIEAGVDSFKIEGRMKREEYIYLVVSIYRKTIDSYYKYGKVIISDSDKLELKKIYNREFTKGFLFNEDNSKIVNQYRPNHIGIKIGVVLGQNNNFIKIKLSDNITQGDGIRIINKIADVGLQLNYIYKDKKLVNSALKGDIISIKVDDKVNIGDEVLKTTDILQLKSIKDKLAKLNRKVLIKGYIKIKQGEYISLVITDNINKIEVKSKEKVECAKTSYLTKEQVMKQVKKLGNTIYDFDFLDIDLENNSFISLKILNELRREAIDKLNNLRQYKIPYKKSIYNIILPDFKINKSLNYYINSYNQYNKIKDEEIDNIYIQNKQLFEQLKIDKRVVKKLPRVLEKHQNFDNKLLIGEIGSLNFYQNNNLDTDFSFNVTNSYTVAFLHSIGVKKITLSYELKDEQIVKIISNYKIRYNKNPNLELIVYGKEELMVSKFNLLKMYKRVENNIYLKDRLNKLYNVIEDEDLMYIYNCKARNNLEKCNYYYSIGINNLRINLLNDSDIEKLNNI